MNGRVKFVSAEQPLNTEPAIDVTVEGITIVVRDVQFRNAVVLIVVRLPEERLTLTRLEQLLNALEPSVVSFVLLKSTDSSFLLSVNVLLPIAVNTEPVSNVTVLRFSTLLNAYVSIVATFFGIVSAVIEEHPVNSYWPIFVSPEGSVKSLRFVQP